LARTVVYSYSDLVPPFAYKIKKAKSEGTMSWYWHIGYW